MGIRTGNFNMQFSNLAAFAPLFPNSGQNNYSKSTVHFLAELAKSPQLKMLLQHVCSVNLTQEGHYFAFDEALEYFGVQFVKQNITNVIINEENLKLQIKAIQSERASADLLFSEFNDKNVNSGGYAFKYNLEAIQKLAKKMYNAFINPDDQKLFRGSGCKGLTPGGYSHLFECYQNGKHRLTKIYYEEVLKITR